MISKEEILSRTNSGLDVFKHYIRSDLRSGLRFCNPLYHDTRPSCNVYYDRKARYYRLKDFGSDEYSGDCFFYVGKLNGLDCNNNRDFVKILEIIDREMNLGLKDGNPIPVPVSTPKPTPEQPAEVKPKPFTYLDKPFSSGELSEWKKSGITEEVLCRYQTLSLREFHCVSNDATPYTLRSTDDEPMYAYIRPKCIKVYRPKSKQRFCYGGIMEDFYCFGLEQLPTHGDILFITGGEKDVMTLAAHGFYAICFGSETASVPLHIIRALSYRFKHIVLLYDTDKEGIKSSLRHQQALAEYHVKRLILPLEGTKQEKDISDYFALGNTANDLKRLFLSLLDTLYRETFSMLRPCEIDLKNPPVAPDVIVSINGVPFGIQGDLLCITGGEGSGKSHYAGALIAGTLATGNNADTLGATLLPNSNGRAVLLYDTEQSENQLYKNIGIVTRRSSLDEMPSCFKAYTLNSITRRERFDSIVNSMDKYYYQFGGIHMVVIDGIADLIRSVNDESESVELIDELHRLAGIYNTCIVCVLHLVPSGMKIRGHLGSEVSRRAAGILSIDKNEKKELSTVKAIKVRDGSPLDTPIQQFAWDRQQAMHLFRGDIGPEEKDNRKETELRNAAKELFSACHYYGFTDLCTRIMELLNVSESTAKNYIRYMRERGIIRKDPQNTTAYIPGNS